MTQNIPTLRAVSAISISLALKEAKIEPDANASYRRALDIYDRIDGELDLDLDGDQPQGVAGRGGTLLYALRDASGKAVLHVRLSASVAKDSGMAYA